MKDEDLKPGPPPEPETARPETEEPRAEEPATGDMKYVFKIVPVDPRSSFDFEDVADK
jgi:hypothetical protein